MDSKYFYLVQIVLAFTIKVIALTIGYLIIRMGKELINDGIKGKFNFKANVKGFGADIYSASPGLLFVLLGVLLIISIVFIKKEFHFKEFAKTPKIEMHTTIQQDTLTN